MSTVIASVSAKPRRRGSRFEPGSGLRQTGGRTLVVSRTIDSDFSGSATILVSTASHFGHSNVRCSDRSGKGEMRASLIRVWHRPQRGRSIAVRGTGVKETSVSLRMILPHAFRHWFDRACLPLRGAQTTNRTYPRERGYDVRGRANSCMNCLPERFWRLFGT